MLLGEVSEDPFQDSRVGMALFIVFMFLVVILLANVLIAIVTDSYKVIQVCFLCTVVGAGCVRCAPIHSSACLQRTYRIKRPRLYSGQTVLISSPRWTPLRMVRSGACVGSKRRKPIWNPLVLKLRLARNLGNS